MALLPLTLIFTHSASGVYAIGAGVHLYIYIYMCVYMTKKKFEWHFSGRLTFSYTSVDLSLNIILD